MVKRNISCGITYIHDPVMYLWLDIFIIYDILIAKVKQLGWRWRNAGKGVAASDFTY